MIFYWDRKNKCKKKELIYGERGLRFLYGSRGGFRKFLLESLSKNAFFSSLYGWWQRRFWTRFKIVPFIQKFQVDASEFELSPTKFRSFNDFFVRKLKSESRPIISDEKVAICPADGRYLVFPNIDTCDGFLVKGKKFSLDSLLKNPSLASSFKEGALAIIRLCPSDYHRFHFPFECVAQKTITLSGALYSVNPLALKQNIAIFTENKRALTVLETPQFGRMLFIEVGATCVGTIHQTFTPNMKVKKGDEKGFFSFGGSSILLLFEKNRIEFDSDLIKATDENLEVLCQMGQSLGKAKQG